MCRASLASAEQPVLSIPIRMLLSNQEIKMMHVEQETAYALGHYSGQKVAVSPHVPMNGLQAGTQQVLDHAKAVVHLLFKHAPQASGVT